MGDQDKRLRTVHVRELTAQAYDELDERLHSGWGKWSFDLERSVLRHQDAADYEIDVAGIDSCAEALDWIVLRKYSRPFNFVGPNDESCPQRAFGVPKAESCNCAVAHRRDASPQGIFF